MKNIVLALIVALFLVGCMQVPTDSVNKTSDAQVVDTPKPTVTEISIDAQQKSTGIEIKDTPVKYAKEGDLIRFSRLKAKDPDGDYLVFAFQAPLNEYGEWQTGPGDAGTYDTTISVTDGKNTTQQLVRIVVESVNQAPEFGSDLKDIKILEGEVLDLNFRITDPEGDEVKVSYDGWRTEFPYTTTYKDAGVHSIKVIASDGTNTVERVVQVSVEDANRPPVLSKLDNVIIAEKDTLKVRADAEDPDGDALTFTYSTPLDIKGEWTTQVGDAGNYDMKVTVSDGKVQDSTTFKVTVVPFNSPPVMQKIEDITITEGETLKVFVDVEDPDEDNVTIKFTGWMTSSTKTTGYSDAGEFTVTVVVSDGYHEVKQTFAVTVLNNNRPPVFVKGSFD